MPMEGGSKTRDNGGGKRAVVTSGKIRTPFEYPMAKGGGAKKSSGASKPSSGKRRY